MIQFLRDHRDLLQFIQNIVCLWVAILMIIFFRKYKRLKRQNDWKAERIEELMDQGAGSSRFKTKFKKIFESDATNDMRDILEDPANSDVMIVHIDNERNLYVMYMHKDPFKIEDEKKK